ncbi:MAG: hypothetical protein ACREP7_06475 [Lysobacter sp.]
MLGQGFESKQSHFRKQAGGIAEMMRRRRRRDSGAPGGFAQAETFQTVFGQDFIGGADQRRLEIAMVIAIGRGGFLRAASLGLRHLYTVQIMR